MPFLFRLFFFCCALYLSFPSYSARLATKKIPAASSLFSSFTVLSDSKNNSIPAWIDKCYDEAINRLHARRKNMCRNITSCLGYDFPSCNAFFHWKITLHFHSLSLSPLPPFFLFFSFSLHLWRGGKKGLKVMVDYRYTINNLK